MRKLFHYLLLLCVISIAPFCQALTPLTVHFLDVGQADCILIQSPAGRNMLIDAGNKSDAQTIIRYLKGQGVRRLEVVVGTHPHADHIGSMDQIINNFVIGRVYLPKVSVNTRTFADLLTAIKHKGLKVTTARAGVDIPLDPALKLRILGPNSATYPNLNDYSAVIKLTYNRVSFLFTGDAEKNAEMELIRAGADLQADVLKVGHHGSSSSTSPAFLKKVAPRYAVLSYGLENTYGHPAPAILKRLADHKITVYHTAKHGSIVIRTDGGTITVPKVNSSPAVNIDNDDRRSTVYITKTGGRYHREGCSHLSRSKIPLPLAQALKKGYIPCNVCKPPAGS